MQQVTGHCVPAELHLTSHGTVNYSLANLKLILAFGFNNFISHIGYNEKKINKGNINTLGQNNTTALGFHLGKFVKI